MWHKVKLVISYEYEYITEDGDNDFDKLNVYLALDKVSTEYFCSDTRFSDDNDKTTPGLVLSSREVEDIFENSNKLCNKNYNFHDYKIVNNNLVVDVEHITSVPYTVNMDLVGYCKCDTDLYNKDLVLIKLNQINIRNEYTGGNVTTLLRPKQ